MSIETEVIAARLDTAGFERVYRDNVRAITGYFARRCTDPHAVADLVQETFVEAIASLSSFDPRRGRPRPWLFGIARRVFAQHCERVSDGRLAAAELAGRRELADDEVEEVIARIDAERSSRQLLLRCAELPELERGALELVDIAGIGSTDAARALGISTSNLRVRLFRARRRLRHDRSER